MSILTDEKTVKKMTQITFFSLIDDHNALIKETV